MEYLSIDRLAATAGVDSEEQISEVAKKAEEHYYEIMEAYGALWQKEHPETAPVLSDGPRTMLLSLLMGLRIDPAINARAAARYKRETGRKEGCLVAPIPLIELERILSDLNPENLDLLAQKIGYITALQARYF